MMSKLKSLFKRTKENEVPFLIEPGTMLDIVKHLDDNYEFKDYKVLKPKHQVMKSEEGELRQRLVETARVLNKGYNEEDDYLLVMQYNGMTAYHKALFCRLVHENIATTKPNTEKES